ncbi:MAG: hypothetical protein VSS75_004065 [Candidatus Parabeggiatoa sp.]|nr:hypothetical protein [Candidatus Parabeggiatoa sp.]
MPRVSVSRRTLNRRDASRLCFEANPNRREASRLFFEASMRREASRLYNGNNPLSPSFHNFARKTRHENDYHIFSVINSIKCHALLPK